jgi:hypothetical protein
LLQREPDRIEHQLVVVNYDNSDLSHAAVPFVPSPSPATFADMLSRGAS